MEGETLPADQDVPRDDNKPRECECNAEEGSLVSMDWFPDDLLEQILACLPFADLVRAGVVCTRWRRIINSETFRKKLLHGVSHRPRFVLHGFLGRPACAYDPVHNVWRKFKLPRFKSRFYSSILGFASSTGLICVYGKSERGIGKLCVCNPLTRIRRHIAPAPSVESQLFATLAISVSRTAPSYRVSLVTSKIPPGARVGYELSIHLYDSETRMWKTCTTEYLRIWRCCNESAICDGVLYFLIISPSTASRENRYGLVMYDLSGRCSNDLLASFVPVPHPHGYGRLMNMKEKLVLVMDIDGYNGVGIWVLNGREWHEIARSPDDYFPGFGSNARLRSCGLNDLICIWSGDGHDHPSPYIATFDMNQKQWSRNNLATVPSQDCKGFCFEPQLDIVP